MQQTPTTSLLAGAERRGRAYIPPSRPRVEPGPLVSKQSSSPSVRHLYHNQTLSSSLNGRRMSPARQETAVVGGRPWRGALGSPSQPPTTRAPPLRSSASASAATSPSTFTPYPVCVSTPSSRPAVGSTSCRLAYANLLILAQVPATVTSSSSGRLAVWPSSPFRAL